MSVNFHIPRKSAKFGIIWRKITVSLLFKILKKKFWGNFNNIFSKITETAVFEAGQVADKKKGWKTQKCFYPYLPQFYTWLRSKALFAIRTDGIGPFGEAPFSLSFRTIDS